MRRGQKRDGEHDVTPAIDIDRYLSKFCCPWLI
jgi:hypothetical protein